MLRRVDHAPFRNILSLIKEVMKRLFDPARPHSTALPVIWVWLYDIDCYWTECMPAMHLMQPETVPIYYASLGGFVGLAEHLIVALHQTSLDNFHVRRSGAQAWQARSLTARCYAAGADELALLNITSFRHSPLYDQLMLAVVHVAAATVFVLLTIGGGRRPWFPLGRLCRLMVPLRVCLCGHIRRSQ
jgi:hypothetical protein